MTPQALAFVRVLCCLAAATGMFCIGAGIYLGKPMAALQGLFVVTMSLTGMVRARLWKRGEEGRERWRTPGQKTKDRGERTEG